MVARRVVPKVGNSAVQKESRLVELWEQRKVVCLAEYSVDLMAAQMVVAKAVTKAE